MVKELGDKIAKNKNNNEEFQNNKSRSSLFDGSNGIWSDIMQRDTGSSHNRHQRVGHNPRFIRIKSIYTKSPMLVALRE
jgi:hypothetical protein